MDRAVNPHILAGLTEISAP